MNAPGNAPGNTPGKTGHASGNTGPATGHGAEALTDAGLRRVALLARLALTDAQLAAQRARMASVLGHIAMLRELNLEGVEPMAHVGNAANRMDDDEPVAGLPTEALMRMAPDAAPPFIRVPKVLGDGGGA